MKDIEKIKAQRLTEPDQASSNRTEKENMQNNKQTGVKKSGYVIPTKAEMIIGKLFNISNSKSSNTVIN